MKAPAPSVLGLPDRRWLNLEGDANCEGDDLVLRPGPGTDWFRDRPALGSALGSAPALVSGIDHDAQSPTGGGCTARFGRIRCSTTTLEDHRDGS